MTTLERAKAALAESDAPELSNHEICTSLVSVARANELPVGFFANLIWRESGFDHVAISRVGAMGIAQFMPDVADKLGVDAFDARDALPASGRLLANCVPASAISALLQPPTMQARNGFPIGCGSAPASPTKRDNT